MGEKIWYVVVLLLLATIANGETPTKDTIHQQIFKCQRGEIKDDNACMRVCETCHPSQASTLGDIDLHQVWNPGQLTVDEVYPQQSLSKAIQNKEEATLAEVDPWEGLPYQHQLCRDCHENHGEPMGNHPWRVAYPEDVDPRFLAPPESLKLFGNEILCATCHDPHGNDSGNLRQINESSALCLSCHNT